MLYPPVHCATLQAVQLFLLTLSWKPAAQVSQPEHLLVFMPPTAQLGTSLHCKMGGQGPGLSAAAGKQHRQAHPPAAAMGSAAEQASLVAPSLTALQLVPSSSYWAVQVVQSQVFEV